MYLFLYFFVKQRSHLLDPHLYVEAYAAICHIRVNLMPLCFENLMPLCLNGLKVLCWSVLWKPFLLVFLSVYHSFFEASIFYLWRLLENEDNLSNTFSRKCLYFLLQTRIKYFELIQVNLPELLNAFSLTWLRASLFFFSEVSWSFCKSFYEHVK